MLCEEQGWALSPFLLCHCLVLPTLPAGIRGGAEGKDALGFNKSLSGDSLMSPSLSAVPWDMGVGEDSGQYPQVGPVGSRPDPSAGGHGICILGAMGEA